MSCPFCCQSLSGHRPGDYLVCENCGAILLAGPGLAVHPASPVEIDRLPETLFTAVLENSCRVMARKLRRKDPLLVKHQQEKRKRKEQSEVQRMD